MQLSTFATVSARTGHADAVAGCLLLRDERTYLRHGPSRQQIQILRGEVCYLFRGSLAQHRPEYVIPQRCADTVVSRRELMMASVVLKQ